MRKIMAGRAIHAKIGRFAAGNGALALVNLAMLAIVILQLKIAPGMLMVVFFRIRYSAVFTGAMAQSFLRAGRLAVNNPVAPDMGSRCGNGVFIGINGLANGAAARINANGGAVILITVFQHPFAPGVVSGAELMVGSVVAALALVIGIPADLGACRRFCLVMLQVMTGGAVDLLHGICLAAHGASALLYLAVLAIIKNYGIVAPGVLMRLRLITAGRNYLFFQNGAAHGAKAHHGMGEFIAVLMVFLDRPVGSGGMLCRRGAVLGICFKIAAVLLLCFMFVRFITVDIHSVIIFAPFDCPCRSKARELRCTIKRTLCSVNMTDSRQCHFFGMITIAALHKSPAVVFAGCRYINPQHIGVAFVLIRFLIGIRIFFCKIICKIKVIGMLIRILFNWLCIRITAELAGIGHNAVALAGGGSGNSAVVIGMVAVAAIRECNGTACRHARVRCGQALGRGVGGDALHIGGGNDPAILACQGTVAVDIVPALCPAMVNQGRSKRHRCSLLHGNGIHFVVCRGLISGHIQHKLHGVSTAVVVCVANDIHPDTKIFVAICIEIIL